jgi:hypothetical protein
MKKVVVLALSSISLVLIFASFSWAKVSDFNALINENISAQKELHSEVKKQMKVTQDSFYPSPKATVVVETESNQINSPTKSKMLKFKKETATQNASRSGKKQLERVSEEFDDASSSF